MHGLWQDVRYGVRGLGRDRGFTFLAVLALALGIGSVTTIYSVIENVLLDPFPYTDAANLVYVNIHDLSQADPQSGRGGFHISELLDYKERAYAFDRIIAATNEDVLYSNGQGTD